MSDSLKTHLSLLYRLKMSPNDADWERFFNQYANVIRRFCRAMGLDDAGSRDVLQETMLLLIRKLPQFTYDPQKGKFRNFLFKLASGKARDALKRIRRQGLVGLEEMDDVEHFQHQQAETEAAMNHAWLLGEVEEALRRMQDETAVTEKSLQVFRDYMIEGRSASEVAKLHQMTRNAVYQVRHNYIQRLRTELSKLHNPFEVHNDS